MPTCEKATGPFTADHLLATIGYLPECRPGLHGHNIGAERAQVFLERSNHPFIRPIDSLRRNTITDNAVVVRTPHTAGKRYGHAGTVNG